MEENKMKDILTENQVNMIAEFLSENANDSVAEEAKKLAENDNIDELKEMDNYDSNNLGGVIDANVLENVNESEEDYMNAFNPYNMNAEDSMKLYNLILKYKNKEKINYYNELPNAIKSMISDTILSANGITSKNEMTKTILDSFISDAKMNNAVEEYRKDMTEVMGDMSNNFSSMISDTFNDIYKNIDELKSTDPEKAAQLESIKNAFTDCMSFDKQRDVLNKTSINKLISKAKLYVDREAGYLENKINDNKIGIHVRELKDIPKIISDKAGCSIDVGNAILVLISMSSYKMDMDDIYNIAYLYKLVDTILICKYINVEDSDDAKILFENMKGLIADYNNRI